MGSLLQISNLEKRPLAFVLSHPTFYHLDNLCSTRHNAWMRAVCGQLKSGIVAAAKTVLDLRATFPDATLADFYDPLTMPPELVKAHQALDRAVDAAYGKTTLNTEAERVAFLFERYQQLTAPLALVEKPAKMRTREPVLPARQEFSQP
ncbi:MAG: hypothetical protein HYV06_08050 [Deltaproteobacteria bacterium]|nr:hypothetical protein [Deltaproteobacteria bacterium]